jgi:hypothetical protein
MYRDKRLAGFDAAAVVEVVEHLDPPRLPAFERVLFEFANPRTVILTTPNREYNVKWESIGASRLRHPDQRFEWTRQEFQEWATRVSQRFSYAVRLVAVGLEDEKLGPPTQMAIFEAANNQSRKTTGQEKHCLTEGDLDLHRSEFAARRVPRK